MIWFQLSLRILAELANLTDFPLGGVEIGTELNFATGLPEATMMDPATIAEGHESNADKGCSQIDGQTERTSEDSIDDETESANRQHQIDE